MRSHAFHLQMSEQNWRDPDLSVLDDLRRPVPAVPLEMLPQPWRDWMADTAKATGAPMDYVLPSVLAGLAALCGAGVRIRVTPAWDEPLVLWLSAVGEPSTGKSAALAPMRRLLEVIEQERRLGDEERRAAHAERCKQSGEGTPFMPSRIVATASGSAALLPTLADIVAGNPCGVLLWRDGDAGWIGDEESEGGQRASWLAGWMAGAITVAPPRQPARSLARFAVSILETVRPERLKAALEAGDDGMAARFLFAWPGPQPYRALAVLQSSRDEDILQRLRALSRLARSADDPCVINVDARAAAPRSTPSWPGCTPSAARPRAWRRRGWARAGR